MLADNSHEILGFIFSEKKKFRMLSATILKGALRVYNKCYMLNLQSS